MLSVFKSIHEREKILCYLVRKDKTEMALKVLNSVSPKKGEGYYWYFVAGVCAGHGNQEVLSQLLKTYGLRQIKYTTYGFRRIRYTAYNKDNVQFSAIKIAIDEHQINVAENNRTSDFYKCINLISATTNVQFSKKQWLDILSAVKKKYNNLFAVNFINNCLPGNIEFQVKDWLKVLLPGMEDVLLHSHNQLMSKQMVEKIKKNNKYKKTAILINLAKCKDVNQVKIRIQNERLIAHGLVTKYNFDWDTIAEMASKLGNVDLCVNIMKYCKYHKIPFDYYIWSRIAESNVNLLPELILYRYNEYKISRVDWWHIAKKAIPSNNIELFEEIFEKNRGGRFFRDREWWSYIRESSRSIKSLEKMILCAKRHKITVRDYPICFLMSHEGLLGMLEFALFSMEQGFFHKTKISNEILTLAVEQQCRLYHYQRLITIANMPSAIARLILSFTGTECLLDEKAINDYPTMSKANSKFSAGILDFYTSVKQKNHGIYIKQQDCLANKKNHDPKKRCIVM